MIDYGRRDPLGAVFGVLPKNLDSLLAWSRTVDGWARRSLKAQEELRSRLQVLLLRGAWQVYRVRCRLMADWWREPASPEQGLPCPKCGRSGHATGAEPSKAGA